MIYLVKSRCQNRQNLISIQTSTGVHSLVSCTDDPDMEFVTSGTCVKYIHAGVKFSRINAKNYPFYEICQIKA